MSLSYEDVQRIADYARFALSEDELYEMQSYLNDAIDLLSPIMSYADDAVDPTFHPIGDLSNVVVPDTDEAPERALSLEAALHNAASSRENLFRVPAILGSED